MHFAAEDRHEVVVRLAVRSGHEAAAAGVYCGGVDTTPTIDRLAHMVDGLHR